MTEDREPVELPAAGEVEMVLEANDVNDAAIASTMHFFQHEVDTNIQHTLSDAVGVLYGATNYLVHRIRKEEMQKLIEELRDAVEKIVPFTEEQRRQTHLAPNRVQ